MPDAYDVNKGVSFNAPKVWASNPITGAANTAVPGSAQDITQGYSQGDMYLIPTGTGNGVYFCKVNTAGAAVWTAVVT